MGRAKGSPKTGGRTKGTKNKAEKIRMQFFKALAELGGLEFIKTAALSDPVPFLRIIGNLLPKELDATINNVHENSLSELE